MSTKKLVTPPLTLEAQQNKLVSLAMDQAEKQLVEGTASSQVITHFLKLGTTREQVELQTLDLQKMLLKEKIDSEKSRRNMDDMFKDVLDALKSYTVQHE